LLEQLGRRCYRAAFESLRQDPLPAHVALIGRMSVRFEDARRVLGVVAEHYIFADRARWFGIGEG
jgi:hypothetical protein